MLGVVINHIDVLLFNKTPSSIHQYWKIKLCRREKKGGGETMTSACRACVRACVQVRAGKALAKKKKKSACIRARFIHSHTYREKKCEPIQQQGV